MHHSHGRALPVKVIFSLIATMLPLRKFGVYMLRLNTSMKMPLRWIYCLLRRVYFILKTDSQNACYWVSSCRCVSHSNALNISYWPGSNKSSRPLFIQYEMRTHVVIPFFEALILFKNCVPSLFIVNFETTVFTFSCLDCLGKIIFRMYAWSELEFEAGKHRLVQSRWWTLCISSGGLLYGVVF